jgi:hypothetical protein
MAGLTHGEGDAVTAAEKAAAFDVLAVAMTNRFADGTWSWWCPTPCGGAETRQTREEAVADLVAWAGRAAALNLKRLGQ